MSEPIRMSIETIDIAIIALVYLLARFLALRAQERLFILQVMARFEEKWPDLQRSWR
jgi:hypothetical protein